MTWSGLIRYLDTTNFKRRLEKFGKAILDSHEAMRYMHPHLHGSISETPDFMRRVNAIVELILYCL